MIFSNRFIFLAALVMLSSCSIVEKSSQHGFSSGYYQLHPASGKSEKVYVEAGESSLGVHRISNGRVERAPMQQIALDASDSLCHYPLKFTKKSLDIDLSAVLIKIRPATDDIPLQAATDFNAALYAGLRHDTYRVRGDMDPLGTCRYAVVNRGYDLGVFAGSGITPIGPFSTSNATDREYTGFVFQYGLAGFIESSFASFGLACGFDTLLGPDRRNWIYHRKPWAGFMVGIALN